MTLLYTIKTLDLEFSLSQGQFLQASELFENPKTTDAQVLAFFKTLTDSSIAADAAAVSFATARADTTTTTDEKIMSVFKTLADVASVTDLASLAPEKFFSDSGTVTDSLIFARSRSFSDLAYPTDTFASQAAFSRSFSDLAYPTDTFASQAAFSRSFTDTAYPTDTFASQAAFSRSFTDTAYATDNSDGEASILDDQEMQFLKSLTDIASVSDSIIVLKTIPLVLTETPSATDAGSLRSQGFADFTYFAEDFVGASRTFT